MNKTIRNTGLFLFVVTPMLAMAAPPVEQILGRWKGTSICRKVPGNESCKDEVTVYVFTRGAKPGTIVAQADKIVNGVQQNMGTFDMTYSDKNQRWEYDFTARAHALWTFKAQEKDLTGTLFILPDNWVARDVVAKKDD